MVLFVHRFSDVVRSKSGEDQSLNGAGEKSQEHGREGYDQRHKKSQYSNNELVSKYVPEKTKR
jgi:hypothetical protein